MNDATQAVKAERDRKVAEMQDLVDPVKRGKGPLSTDERARFEGLEIEIRRLGRQLVAYEALEKLGANGDGLDFNGHLAVRSSPQTYSPHGTDSYFRDLAYVASSHLDSRAQAAAPAALDRLHRHGREVEVVARSQPRGKVARALTGISHDLKRRGAVTEFERRVNPNTTAGTGGEFVPPLWDEFTFGPALRPSRIFANRITNLPLPAGIDVINIPKITLGALTGPQTANAAPVASQDIKTTVATAAVNTISGQEDISMQLLEQSPLPMDNVVQDDLQRDYDEQLETLILVGSGVSGQHLGLFNLPTSSSPAPNSANASSVNVQSANFFNATGSQFSSVVKAVTQIETLTFSAYPPTAIWTHPRRANSWACQSDSQTTGAGRPYYTNYGPFNALGRPASRPAPEGVAGDLFGLPVVQSATFPTTVSSTGAVTYPTGSSTYDGVIVLNEAALMLYEGALRYRALPEILSGTLQIRFQIYGYSAFIPTRFPTAVALLYGAGMAAPTF